MYVIPDSHDAVETKPGSYVKSPAAESCAMSTTSGPTLPERTGKSIGLPPSIDRRADFSAMSGSSFRGDGASERDYRARPFGVNETHARRGLRGECVVTSPMHRL